MANAIMGSDKSTPAREAVLGVTNTLRGAAGEKVAVDTKLLDCTEKFEVDGEGKPVYHGISAPGTAVGTATWQIKKYTYDGSSKAVTDIQWASGTDEFDKTWTGRAGYAYS